jgi:small GTP-binding protein
MIQKKVSLLGAFAVGKTSLVSRFVHSIFSDAYLTTVGVKIEKKVLQVDAQQLTLLLWDLAGEDEFVQVRMSYLRGSSGYLLVADGTRRNTIDTICALQEQVETTLGDIPFVVVLNKMDLEDDWIVDDNLCAEFATRGWSIVNTSAKSGVGVEEAFAILGRKMLESG